MEECLPNTCEALGFSPSSGNEIKLRQIKKGRRLGFQIVKSFRVAQIQLHPECLALL